MGTLSCQSLSPSFSTISRLTTHLVQPKSSKSNSFPWVPDYGTFNSTGMVTGFTGLLTRGVVVRVNVTPLWSRQSSPICIGRRAELDSFNSLHRSFIGSQGELSHLLGKSAVGSSVPLLSTLEASHGMTFGAEMAPGYSPGVPLVQGGRATLSAGIVAARPGQIDFHLFS